MERATAIPEKRPRGLPSENATDFHSFGMSAGRGSQAATGGVLDDDGRPLYQLGLEAPDFIEYDSAPTSLRQRSPDLYCDFRKQISSGSRRSDGTTGSTGPTGSIDADVMSSGKSSQSEESCVSPHRDRGHTEPAALQLRSQTRGLAAQIAILNGVRGLATQITTQNPGYATTFAAPVAPPQPLGLGLQPPQPQPARQSGSSVGKGATKILVHDLPKTYMKNAFLAEVKDAGFRPYHDFDSLNFPTDAMTGLNHGYCTINFVTVGTARAFSSSFDGRRLRLCSDTAISARPFMQLDSDEIDGLELGMEIEGFPRGVSV